MLLSFKMYDQSWRKIVDDSSKTSQIKQYMQLATAKHSHNE